MVGFSDEGCAADPSTGLALSVVFGIAGIVLAAAQVYLILKLRRDEAPIWSGSTQDRSETQKTDNR
jgi:putative exporter of polyketide antibiotics